MLDQLIVFKHKVAQERSKLRRQQEMVEKGRARRRNLKQIQAQLDNLAAAARTLARPRDRKFRQRILTAVQQTWGGAVDQIGKPGWYTAPETHSYDNRLFDYIVTGRQQALKKVHRERLFEKEFGDEKRRRSEAPGATRPDDPPAAAPRTPDRTGARASEPAPEFHEYWTTWQTVDEWDKALLRAGDGDIANWNKLYSRVEAAARSKSRKKS
jgi:hypothetical protein